MKKIVFITFFPILMILNLYFYNQILKVNIKKGTLYTSQYELNKNIKLAGEWEIIKNGESSYLTKRNYFFENLNKDNKKIEAKLKIFFENEVEDYGIKIPYSEDFNKIYINGEEINFRKKLRNIFILESKNNFVEIKIIGKNANRFISKINKEIYLGKMSNLILKNEKVLATSLAFPYILLSICIFNLIYSIMGKNKLHFILSLFSSLILFSILLNGENEIILLFLLKNNLLYNVLKNIFYYSTCIVLVFYTNKVFYNILKNKMVDAFFISGLILLCSSVAFYKFNLIFFNIFNIIFISILIYFNYKFYKVKKHLILKLKYYEFIVLISAFILDKIYFYKFGVDKIYFYNVLFVFIILNTVLSFKRNHKILLRKLVLNLKTSKNIKNSMLQYDKLLEKEKKLANISHEIRTPLNPIISYSKILSEKETDENKKKMLLRIKDSANKVLDIVNDVLSNKKQNNLNLENRIEKEEVELKKIVKEIILEMNVTFEKKLSDIRFIKNIKAIPDLVISDKNKIICIIKNILQNAFKYTESGEIYLELRVEDNVLKYIIIDTGIGIPQNKKDKIFEEFEQGKIDNMGVGLGLSLVKKYINQLKGWVNVESEEGKGTKFEVYFPVKRINKVQDQEGENIFNNWKENIEKTPPLKRVLYKFILKLPKVIKELEKSIENKDTEETLGITHKLKGTSGTLKMWEINDYVNKISDEILKENKDYDKVKAIFLSLKRVTDSLPYEGEYRKNANKRKFNKNK